MATHLSPLTGHLAVINPRQLAPTVGQRTVVLWFLEGTFQGIEKLGIDQRKKSSRELSVTASSADAAAAVWRVISLRSGPACRLRPCPTKRAAARGPCCQQAATSVFRDRLGFSSHAVKIWNRGTHIPSTEVVLLEHYKS